MYHALTVELPEDLFQSLQRIAQNTQRPIEDVVLCAATTRLPASKGLPDEIIENLSSLELLDAAALRQVMLSSGPAQSAQVLCELLIQQQFSALSVAAQSELDELLHEADLLLLRKARAALLLRLRGNPVPSLKELREQIPFA